MKQETNDEKKWCVYVHINKVNGKMYVGITCKIPKSRWKNGNGYEHNLYFTRSIKKYGWDNFEHIILCKCKSENEAKNIEKYLIKNWNTKQPNGYNCTEGGEGCLGLYTPRIKKRKPVLQFNLDGIFIKEWESLSSIKKKHNPHIQLL